MEWKGRDKVLCFQRPIAVCLLLYFLSDWTLYPLNHWVIADGKKLSLFSICQQVLIFSFAALLFSYCEYLCFYRLEVRCSLANLCDMLVLSHIIVCSMFCWSRICREVLFSKLMRYKKFTCCAFKNWTSWESTLWDLDQCSCPLA